MSWGMLFFCLVISSVTYILFIMATRILLLYTGVPKRYQPFGHKPEGGRKGQLLSPRHDRHRSALFYVARGKFDKKNTTINKAPKCNYSC